MSKPRTSKDVKVPEENVSAYVVKMESEGWRLDSTGRPEWDWTFKDNRVPLTFSKAAES